MEKAEAGGSKDHIHHRSLWFCHGDVIPEGMKLPQKIKGVQGIDFWSVGAGRGRIVCTETVGADFGRLLNHNEWRASEGAKVLDEKLRQAAERPVLECDNLLSHYAKPATFPL